MSTTTPPSPGDERASLVEDTVVRQLALGVAGRDHAAAQQRGGVLCRARCAAVGEADHTSQPPAVLAARSSSAAGCREEGRPEHQVLRRVAGDGKLREDDHVGTGGRGVGGGGRRGARRCRRGRRRWCSAGRARCGPRGQGRAAAAGLGYSRPADVDVVRPPTRGRRRFWRWRMTVPMNRWRSSRARVERPVVAADPLVLESVQGSRMPSRISGCSSRRRRTLPARRGARSRISS